MQQQFIDLISKFNKASIETTKDLIDINVKAFEKFTEKQTEMVSECMEMGLKQVEAARDIKDAKGFTDYCTTQSKEMQKSADKFYAGTKDAIDLMVETGEEMNTWMKKGMDTAASTLKPVSTSSKKAA